MSGRGSLTEEDRAFNEAATKAFIEANKLAARELEPLFRVCRQHRAACNVYVDRIVELEKEIDKRDARIAELELRLSQRLDQAMRNE